MQDLAARGLFLNAHKTVKVAQPPSQFVLSNGQGIQMEFGEYGHKNDWAVSWAWVVSEEHLGCSIPFTISQPAAPAGHFSPVNIF